jgi:hypothetical protein
MGRMPVAPLNLKNKVMEKKKKHGGARKNAGRKPVEDKKQQVNLFIESSLIEWHGGKTEVQKKCYAFLREKKK